MTVKMLQPESDLWQVETETHHTISNLWLSFAYLDLSLCSTGQHNVRSDRPRAETGWQQWQILQVFYADFDQPNKQILLYPNSLSHND